MTSPMEAAVTLFTLFVEHGLLLSNLACNPPREHGPGRVSIHAMIVENQQNVEGTGATFDAAFEALIAHRDRKLKECPPAAGTITIHLSRSLESLRLAIEKATATGVVTRYLPEGHEHPDLHPSMAEGWLQRALREPVVLATHSHAFLLRAQLWIAQKKIPAENVLVWWHDGNEVQKVGVGPDGRLTTGLPTGLWGKVNEDARALFTASR